jgi:hypothetical protein
MARHGAGTMSSHKGLKFRKGKVDLCIFVRDEAENITIIAVYVDDLKLVTKNTDTMDRVKADIVARFRMEDLGKLHHCLVISTKYNQDEEYLQLQQKQ